MSDSGTNAAPATRGRTQRAGAPTKSAPDLAIIGYQALLDRTGFSPGVIDGAMGRKTTLALTAYQLSRGLDASGQIDSATLTALLKGEPFPATKPYRVSAEDLDLIGPLPTDWNEKARLERLDYESLSALLAERGHCTQATLGRLNPGRDLNRLPAGDTVILPNVDDEIETPGASALEVNLSLKTVRALNASRGTIALLHCSIAKTDEKLPRGPARVMAVAFDPVYHFDPEMWPEVHNVASKLVIPPGPRNPVGLAWVGLSLPGYGIHGTPAPEMIGKSGSHGCIRLANWDAVRLAKMVKTGIPVRFIPK